MDILEQVVDDIRMEDGALVENPDVSMSEGGEKKYGESEKWIKDKEVPTHTESSRVVISTTEKEHVLPSRIEIDVMDPSTHSTYPPSHSTSSHDRVLFHIFTGIQRKCYQHLIQIYLVLNNTIHSPVDDHLCENIFS